MTSLRSLGRTSPRWGSDPHPQGARVDAARNARTSQGPLATLVRAGSDDGGAPLLADASKRIAAFRPKQLSAGSKSMTVAVRDLDQRCRGGVDRLRSTGRHQVRATTTTATTVGRKTTTTTATAAEPAAATTTAAAAANEEGRTRGSGGAAAAIPTYAEAPGGAAPAGATNLQNRGDSEAAEAARAARATAAAATATTAPGGAAPGAGAAVVAAARATRATRDDEKEAAD